MTPPTTTTMRARAARAQHGDVRLARAMVARYETAVAEHPPAGTPLTLRQDTQSRNLAHWRRRLAQHSSQTDPTE